MTDNNMSQSNEGQGVNKPKDNTITLRVPKINTQVVVLGLVALVTLFQTVQLVKIGSKAGSTVKAAPASTSTGSGASGSDSNVPQSMVGGC